MPGSNFSLKLFENADLPKLKGIQPPDWNDITPFYEYYLANNDCKVFKIAEGNELIGTGAVLSHGETAWLAHIIVHPDRRNSGLGNMITSTLIQEAFKMNCKTIYLIATPLGEPVYRKLGFETEGSYTFYKDITIGNHEREDVRIMEYQVSHLDAVLQLDRAVSGEERKSRLLPHLPSLKVFVDSGELKGFFLPGLGEGLIEASDTEAGMALAWLRFRT